MINVRNRDGRGRGLTLRTIARSRSRVSRRSIYADELLTTQSIDQQPRCQRWRTIKPSALSALFSPVSGNTWRYAWST